MKCEKDGRSAERISKSTVSRNSYCVELYFCVVLVHSLFLCLPSTYPFSVIVAPVSTTIKITIEMNHLSLWYPKHLPRAKRNSALIMQYVVWSFLCIRIINTAKLYLVFNCCCPFLTFLFISIMFAIPSFSSFSSSSSFAFYFPISPYLQSFANHGFSRSLSI